MTLSKLSSTMCNVSDTFSLISSWFKIFEVFCATIISYFPFVGVKFFPPFIPWIADAYILNDGDHQKVHYPRLCQFHETDFFSNSSPWFFYVGGAGRTSLSKLLFSPFEIVWNEQFLLHKIFFSLFIYLLKYTN